MDKVEFLKDEMVVTRLKALAYLAEQLPMALMTPIMLAGSEAFVASVMYYGTVKEAASKGVNAAKPVYGDLSQRFSKKGNTINPKKD
ncbi:hypothetical protein [uncultured Chryseobacterium sp.]|uniref:hypothetical protein n=1 Tax=uncultured Chryseobacterium sp. TaxID=259322 RepID=UPI0025D9BF0C|nr:hypothetical protein [uncultured Chryseobacterium sp.]